MGFYFRVPLPGPFGYSVRLGKHRRRRRKPQQRARQAPRLSAAQRARQEAEHAERVEHYRQERLAREARTFVAEATEVGHNDKGELTFKLVPWDKSRPTYDVTVPEADARQMGILSIRNHQRMDCVLNAAGDNFERLARAR